MKNLTTKVLLVCTLLLAVKAKSQLVLSASPIGPCGGTTSGVFLSLNGNVPSATNYVWVATGPSPTMAAYSNTSSVNNATISLPAAGLYTVTMYPYSAGSVLISGSVLTSTFFNSPNPVISIASTASVICAGNTVTLTASGATTYTWSNGFFGSSIVVTPTANSCYTVAAQGNGTCMVNATQCISLTTLAPTVTVNQANNFNLCGGSAVITAYGANTYTWSTGSNASSINVTTVGCYTVSGSTGCGSSSTVICVGGTVSALPQMTLAGPSTVCGPTVATISVVNATAYPNISWMSWNMSTCCPVTGSAVTATVTGPMCFTATATNGGCTTSSMFCLNYNSNTLTTFPTGNYTTCAASPIQVSASGAATYTWYWNGGNATGSAFTPTAIGCYTVVGTNTACPTQTGSAQVCLNALLSPPSPSLSFVNGQPCTFYPIAISPSGGNTYTLVGTVNNSLAAFVATNSNPIYIYQYNPGAYCFTLTASNGQGCNATSVFCYTVSPSPAITALGAGTICAGSSKTLQANGATSYTWVGLSNNATVFVTPTVSTCYTVIGSAPNGCTNSTMVCVTPVSGATAGIIASSPTVCEGSSVTFTAGSAASYTWVGGPNTSTYNVIPLSSTIYTLSVFGNNGCSGTQTVAVGVLTTCANVWPGDANSDGIVNSTDILELGLQATNTGAARSPGGNAYTSQFANVWPGTISNGKNKCHADCNGDGVVNANDTVAVYNNFSLSHAFKPTPAASGDEITLLANSSGLEIGRWNTVDVILGNSGNQVQALGVAFEINFDQSKIVPDSIWIEFVNSDFTSDNQYLYFRKTSFTTGKLFVALSRTDGANKNYSTRIAVLHFKVSEQTAVGTTINFGVSAAEKMTASGDISAIVGDSQALTATDNLSGISTNAALTKMIVYPNPAKDILVISASNTSVYQITLTDLSGRVIINSSSSNVTELNVSDIENGVYLLKLNDATGSQSQRITIMH